MDETREQIIQQLSTTEFACSSLTRLSGGTANFVYRAKVASTGDSIIIKHAKEYLASNTAFKLDITRCDHETAILQALDSLPPCAVGNVTVKTPRLFHFHQKSHTQVLEDLPDSLDLKTFLLSQNCASLSKPVGLSIGRALGSWLRSFHVWSGKDQPSRNGIPSQNKPMQQIKFYANYTLLMETIETFPVLEKSRDIFGHVRDLAAAELECQDYSEEYGVIHGDFWTGKFVNPPTSFKLQLRYFDVLIANNSQLTAVDSIDLFIVDWELSQVGARALDLGQMIAELYETNLFKNLESGLWIIEGFVKGYGSLSEEMAFRTAIHVGVHLICWGSRVTGWGSQEQVEEVVKVGRDIVVHAWMKNKKWFEDGMLGCLFAQ